MWCSRRPLHAAIHRPGERHAARGVTLVELVTSVAVLGLLVALLLPAIQGARESARRARCANNLHQIGVAVLGYEAAYSLLPLPAGIPNFSPRGGGPVAHRQYSIYTRILPYLDLSPAYSSVNFHVPLADPYLHDPAALHRAGSLANQTVMQLSIGVLLCPSDGRPQEPGSVNYRANLGVERWYFSRNGPLMDGVKPIPISAIRDGTSQTVGFSERLRGSSGTGGVDLRSDLVILPEGSMGAQWTLDEAIRRCADQAYGVDGVFVHTGRSWFVGALSQTCYNHTILPNSTSPDCASRMSDPISGLVGPRSNHPTGVLVLFMDGSTRFLRNSIDVSVWRALGTRAGGEVVEVE